MEVLAINIRCDELECANNGDGYCELGDTDFTPLVIEEGVERRMTNADKIRQMTDDEELLSAIGTGCYRCVYNNGECDSGYGEGCIAGNLEWLRKEANEDADK